MLLSLCAATLSGCTAMPQSSAHQKLCNVTLPVERYRTCAPNVRSDK
jgi:hypothetical protein